MVILIVALIIFCYICNEKKEEDKEEKMDEEKMMDKMDMMMDAAWSRHDTISTLPDHAKELSYPSLYSVNFTAIHISLI